MKIVVLCGGLSTERDVSLTTGSMVGRALHECGHQVVLVDMFLGEEQPLTDIEAYFSVGGHTVHSGVTTIAPDIAAVRAQRADKSASRLGPGVIELMCAADIVFLALHGADGEDGKIQAMLDLLGVKYTGSGALGSSLAMDKNLAKMVLDAHQIQTPFGCLLSEGDPIPSNITFPCVVKPCCGGSSVATELVHDAAELPKALSAVYALNDRALVEEYIKGKEYSVAVLDDQALPVILLDYDADIFDYVVKYQAGVCREICPAPISDELAQRLQQIAVRAHSALGLSVYSRVDFIVTDDGTIYTLEVNTLPGMTDASIVPREAAAAGIGYNELCQKIIDLSLARFDD